MLSVNTCFIQIAITPLLGRPLSPIHLRVPIQLASELACKKNDGTSDKLHFTEVIYRKNLECFIDNTLIKCYSFVKTIFCYC